MNIKSHDEWTQQIILPPLTPATVKRAKEGLAAARDRAVTHSIQEALNQIRGIAEGHSECRISGAVRAIVMRSLIHALFRVRVEYLERIPKGPAMLASNHLNHIDPFLLLSEVPTSPYYYILGDARTLYNKWWKRQILRLSGDVIPLERLWKEELAVIEGAKAGRKELVDLAAAIEQDVSSGGDIQTLRQINRAVQVILARGDGIILFPEGRLGTTEGQLQLPLKRGTAIYALRTGVPIVPVALIGTQNLYLWKELTIRFGEPLRFPRSNRPKRQEVYKVLEALQNSLSALLPEDYREPEEPKPLRYFLNHMLC
ncbi:MAG: lysophospholipid acyltransferase family protein [Xenococcaceae cyanobacterium]